MTEPLINTLHWQKLRKILLDALGGLGSADLDMEERTKLLAFMSENWNLQVPRQEEFANFEQVMRREIRDLRHRLEHEIQKREDIADTMRYPMIDEVE